MKILSLDEIPDEWKKDLNATGRDRYTLFAEDVAAGLPGILTMSVSDIVNTLTNLPKESFPYVELKLKKDVKKLSRLNKSGHMGVVLGEDPDTSVLLEGIIDNEGIKFGNLKGIDFSL